MEFEYKKEFAKDKPSLEGRQYGFIAQEFGDVIPESVSLAKEKVGTKDIEDFHVLNTSCLNPILVKAVQEQGQMIEEQRKLIALQNQTINELDSRLKKLES